MRGGELADTVHLRGARRAAITTGQTPRSANIETKIGLIGPDGGNDSRPWRSSFCSSALPLPPVEKTNAPNAAQTPRRPNFLSALGSSGFDPISCMRSPRRAGEAAALGPPIRRLLPRSKAPRLPAADNLRAVGSIIARPENAWAQHDKPNIAADASTSFEAISSCSFSQISALPSTCASGLLRIRISESVLFPCGR